MRGTHGRVAKPALPIFRNPCYIHAIETRQKARIMKTLKWIFNDVSDAFPDSHPVIKAGLTFLAIMGMTAFASYIALDLISEGLGNCLKSCAGTAFDSMKTSILPPKNLMNEATATDKGMETSPEQAREIAARRSHLAMSLMNTYHPF